MSPRTVTQRLLADLESAVRALYGDFEAAAAGEKSALLQVFRDEHEEYALRGLRRLSAGLAALDSSRPWLCYWIVHSLALLGRPVDGDLYDRTVDFLARCRDPDGGYAGGPGQMPHLATTYAATCTLVALGGERALASIDRRAVLGYLLRMKQPCGGFRVHDGGEMDMRGSFTALAVAHLLDVMEPELVAGVPEHVRSCQTYEGGIGGEPGSEAHGGYTFCGLAALALIDRLHVLDLPALVNWVAFRQGRVEGGFQGRTNKLVDGCYSFWQGGCIHLLQQQMGALASQQSAALAGLHLSHDDDGRDQEIQSSSEVQDSAAELKGEEDFHSAGERSPSEEDECDEEDEGWDSDFQCTAEELFPSSDFDIRRGPSTYSRPPVELVELDDSRNNDTPEASTNFDDASIPCVEDRWDDVLEGPIFNSRALQAYILLCCQDFEGGLRDKLGKPCDYYHTCYCLSGLAIAQYSAGHRTGAPPPASGVLGPYSNLVEATHPLCNVRLDRYWEARNYFKRTNLDGSSKSMSGSSAA